MSLYNKLHKPISEKLSTVFEGDIIRLQFLILYTLITQYFQ